MSNNKLKSGFLLTLEGIDGAGKSSIAKALANFFIDNHCPVILTREPGATALGNFLRTILHERNFDINNKAEFLLFAADRAQHMEAIVEPALSNGQIVISDRMADSSLAYQGYGRNLDKEMIKRINCWAMNNKIPDLTLYLKIDYETAMLRLSSRTSYTAFEKEKIKFFNKVIDGFDEIFSARENVIIIDAQESLENVIKNAIEKTWSFYQAWLNFK